MLTHPILEGEVLTHGFEYTYTIHTKQQKRCINTHTFHFDVINHNVHSANF